MTEPMNRIDALMQRVYAVSAKKGGPGLGRMRYLLALLGNPERSLSCFHVAGTNGKGSVTAFLSAALEAAGYRVCRYVSPHLIRYTERMISSGREIPEEDFIRLGERVLSCTDELVRAGYGCPTEFEVLTALAFLWFQEEAPDVCVLECGLGGILDSTNVIERPIVSVITEIGSDHEAFLGSTIPEIARNKAGILKKGVTAVSGASRIEAAQTIREAAGRCGAPLYETAEASYTYRRSGMQYEIDAELMGRRYSGLRIGLQGAHQVRNAVTALAALILSESSGFPVTEAAIREGFEQAFIPGRFQVLGWDPWFIVDGGHNPDGIRAAAGTLRELFPEETASGEKVLVITGCFRDKDYRTMVKILKEELPEVRYLATEPNAPRALPKEELEPVLLESGLRVSGRCAVEEVCRFADAGEYHVVLAVGSIYLIGDIIQFYVMKGR